jgi:PPK2 family polyphosphate:nucleotide phosphotransferase
MSDTSGPSLLIPELLDSLRTAVEDLRVQPDTTLDLSTIGTDDTSAWDGDKGQGKSAVGVLNARLEALQEQLFAEGVQRVLVVLQATDTAGKDSTIAHVFNGVNPQGVKVAAFKKPTKEELSRDYLWRVHAAVPADGQITIFNRSHYEDVLIVRVHDLVPRQRWERRYDHIADFERMLTDEGTQIVKFFLHLSKDEQAERLQQRLDNPEKHWKFAKSDLDERLLWDEYQQAFADAIQRTSTDAAPWYVIPADRKWYRNLVISQILVNLLESLHMQWPQAEEGLADITIV